MAVLTLEDSPAAQAIKELRVCRGYMLACAASLDKAGEREAHHSLLLSLTSLDDTLAALEGPPTIAMRPTVADDVRMDRMADFDPEMV